VVVESSAAPLNVHTGVIRPSRLLSSVGALKQMKHTDQIGADRVTATLQLDGTQTVGDIFEFPFYARGNETQFMISTQGDTVNGIWELYVNGQLEPVWNTIDEAGKFYVEDVGTGYTDDTTDAGDAGAGDVDMLPAAEAINDRCLFGWGAPFRGIRIDIGTPGVGATGVWEYWDGAAWSAIPQVVDGTAGLTAAAGNHDVTFDPDLMTGWAANDPGAASTETLYYVQFRVTAANFTTIPIADQIWINGGHNEYSAGSAAINRLITLVNSINPGYNLIRAVVTGKHYAATADYYIHIAGASIQ